MQTIHCIGSDKKNGEFQFSYEFIKEKGIEKHIYMIYKKPADKKQFFEMEIWKSSDDRFISTNMNHNNHKELMRKGIPSTMIEMISHQFAQPIYSSSNECKIFENEFRSESATSLWKKLVQNGKARYDDKQDRFIFIAY